MFNTHAMTSGPEREGETETGRQRERERGRERERERERERKGTIGVRAKEGGSAKSRKTAQSISFFYQAHENAQFCRQLEDEKQ